MKLIVLSLIAIAISSCIYKQQSDVRAKWSDTSNGLSARLIFTISDSNTHAKIIHPKLLLRNISKNPIKFLKCIYNTGNFSIQQNGKNIVNQGSVRSGPVGAEVITIEPFEIIEFDTYDYGYGIKPDSTMYTFNTSSLQLNLQPGVYRVNHNFTFNNEELLKALKLYNWLDTPPNEIWTGELLNRNIKMDLK